MQPTNSLLAPDISPSPEARPFWDAAKSHELKMPYCSNCQEFFFYPRTLCPSCGSRDIQWRLTSGRGRVYTFCIQYQTSVPGLRDGLPFVTAIIELEEGPRLMSFLVDVSPDPEALSCDMPVKVAFIELPDGQTLPVFRPV